MANTKVSALPAAGSFLTADEVPVNEAGTSKKVTGTQMATFFGLRKLDVQSTASAASLTLTVPAGTYLSLIIDFTGRTDNAAVQALLCQFNGDAGANYDYQITQDTNVTVTGVAPTVASTTGRCGMLVASGATAGAVSGFRIVIENADSTTLRKNWNWIGGGWSTDAAANALLETGQGQWRNTANAISSIFLKGTVGNLINARAILYGQL